MTELVERVQQDLEKAFTCKREWELTEYVDSKLTFNHNTEGKRTVRFTQPVLIKKFNEEYEVPEGPVLKTPAVEGQVLVTWDGDGTVRLRETGLLHSVKRNTYDIIVWHKTTFNG